MSCESRRESEPISEVELAEVVVPRVFSVRELSAIPTPEETTFRHVLATVYKNPTLLDQLPDFPDEYLKSDKLIGFATEEVDLPKLADWVERIGMSDLMELYQEVAVSELTRVAWFDFSIVEKIKDANLERVRLMRVLQEVSRIYKKELFIEEITREAKARIARFFPELLPLEASRVYLNFGRGSSFMVFGKRFIPAFNVSEKQTIESSYSLISLTEREHCVSALIHELIHQKHCELVGLERWIKYSDTYHSNYYRKLWLNIREGLATFGELYIMQRYYKSLLKTDSARAVIVRQEIKKALEIINDPPDSEYSVGEEIMRVLSKTYGRRQITTIVQGIDMDTIEGLIMWDYRKIINNPLFLIDLSKVKYY